MMQTHYMVAAASAGRSVLVAKALELHDGDGASHQRVANYEKSEKWEGTAT
jgi:hypothetical protein